VSAFVNIRLDWWLMTSGQLIRMARTRAGMTQQQLADRLERPITQINRWERDGNEPGLSTLLRIIKACGFELSLTLERYEPNQTLEAELARLSKLRPSERLRLMLEGTKPDDD
jgi:transcriptional regulator with XRE-family HTH domain